jgi:hypothetical protein
MDTETIGDIADLAHQLQTLGLAISPFKERLESAIKRLNAQNSRIEWDGRQFIATCTPQPQDCGPLT